ncbi:MAG: hypothetical protein Q8P67_10825, partial [archaeon]|nr:hypothetical protein [archaeon]
MAATAEAQLTYTQHIDFLEAVFSQAAAGDYQATAGGYASLRSVRATVARLLEVAAEKQQEDRIERLRKFEEQLEG